MTQEQIEGLLAEARKRYPIGTIFESAYDSGKRGAYKGPTYGVGKYEEELAGMKDIIWALGEDGRTQGWLHRDGVWAPTFFPDLNYQIY